MKYPTCTYEDFLSKMVLSYPTKIDDFKIRRTLKNMEVDLHGF